MTADVSKSIVTSMTGAIPRGKRGEDVWDLPASLSMGMGIARSAPRDLQGPGFLNPQSPKPEWRSSPPATRCKGVRTHGLFSPRGVVPSHASAGTPSAQVSTLVRIASSEYEDTLTWSRLRVTVYTSPFGRALQGARVGLSLLVAGRGSGHRGGE